MHTAEQLKQWQINKKWSIYWQPPKNSTSQIIPSIELTHLNFSKGLHQTYPLLKRETICNDKSQYSQVGTISNNISSTLATENIESTSTQVISEYNQDLQSYLSYVKKGCRLYDGVDNIQENVVVAIAPKRKNRLPWFGRVIEINQNQKELNVRWMDRLENKTIYFYLTNNNSIIHFDTVICNGIEFEPLLDKKLMWKLVTPL